MGFSKNKNTKGLAIKVTHPWHPGAEFIFHFPKRLPQSALDAEKGFVGLKDDEREDAARLALIGVVAEMVTREPEGFDDFIVGGPRTLPERMREYFDDPEQPELEQIIVSVWRGYKAAAIPAAYLFRPSDSGAAGGLSPQKA